MMRSISIALTALTAINLVVADTTLSVIPLGKDQNVIRRSSTDGESTEGTVTVQNVRALWSALHGIDGSVPGRRRLPTTEGMPLVPDLFSKPDKGMVVSLMVEGSVDYSEQMPIMSQLLLENKSEVARPMTVDTGSYGQALYEIANSASSKEGSTMSTLMFQIKNNADASVADAKIGKLVETLKSDQDRTTLLHVVIDDSLSQFSSALAESDLMESTPRRKLQSAENATDASGSTSSSTTTTTDSSKTIFQIQYSQTCLWTTLGLFTILFYSMNLMSNMPLMADTLLFGESAKMVSE